MNHRTVEALMAGIAPVIRQFVDKATGVFAERITALEARTIEKGEAGADGKDGRDGIDGKDGAPGPQGERGEKGEAGADGKDGRDGIDGKDGAPGPQGERGEKGEAGADGKDGAPGRDGQPGVPGRDGKDGARGADGKDGADGLGFDDLSIEHDGERGVTLRFVRGDKVKEFALTLPIVIDRGVWREGEFKRGDGVSWGGSFFIAQRDTSAKPETSPDWRLAVKRGRDGRDGKAGDRGEKGDKGERGEPGPRGYGG